MAKIEPEVKFLQNKQRNLLLAQGLSAPAGPEDLYRILNDSSTSLNSEQIAQGRAAIKRLSTYKPPSKFQDIQTYALMVDLADKIRSTADAMGLRIPSEPLLASFASGQVNALTIHVPKARRSLVVFEDQMFTFANLFAKVLGQTIV